MAETIAEPIPQFSLQRQMAELARSMEAAVARVLASGRYAQGPECEAFEREVAAFLAPDGGLEAVTCSSGTDALHLSLRAVGVRAGEVVLTTPFTFFATASSILLSGGVPEFVDILAGDFNLDPERLEAALKVKRATRVAAIVPVHLYGGMAAMPEIMRIANAAGIPVVEDAAQAIGAHRDGRAAGAWGAAGCFSFYPTKNLGALGEGGLVTTTDNALTERLRMLRVHGSRRRYEHEALGWNARMHELQAAMLREKLPRLAGWNQRRREIAATYSEQLAGVDGVQTPAITAGHVFHQYVVRAQRRDDLRSYLKEKYAISAEVYYPIPLHRQPLLRDRVPAGARFPVTDQAAAEVLALPLFPELNDAEVGRVSAAIRAFYQS